MRVRVLEQKEGNITNGYSSSHQAIDLVGINPELDYVTAHSAGRVILYQDGYDNLKGSVGNLSYGNFVKIDNGNGYATLYAHMKKNLLVKNGQYVEKGQRLGYMSDSGNAYGKHLHFEVWKDDVRINPYDFLDKDLYTNSLKYKIGDTVVIDGVYKSSTSDVKLNPLINTGVITRIVDNVRNPYLLNNGNIGWVNENDIIDNIKYLSNSNYKGTSIVDALNQIKVDSSFIYRSKLAEVNNIKNYTGTIEQNTTMLNLLRRGMLKSI